MIGQNLAMGRNLSRSDFIIGLEAQMAYLPVIVGGSWPG